MELILSEIFELPNSNIYSVEDSFSKDHREGMIGEKEKIRDKVSCIFIRRLLVCLVAVWRVYGRHLQMGRRDFWKILVDSSYVSDRSALLLYKTQDDSSIDSL